jgi:hypothetical protein
LEFGNGVERRNGDKKKKLFTQLTGSWLRKIDDMANR